jgi:hypothetical protein
LLAAFDWFVSNRWLNRWLTSFVYGLVAASPLIGFSYFGGERMRAVLVLAGMLIWLVVLFGWGLFLHERVANGRIAISGRHVLLTFSVLLALGIALGVMLGGR